MSTYRQRTQLSDQDFLYLSMHTLKLRVSDRMYDKLMHVIVQLDKSEVEILDEDATFESTQRHLQSELNEITEGKAIFHSVEEVDQILDAMLK